MKEKSSEILFEEVQSRTNKNTTNFFKVVVAIVFIALVLNLLLHKGRTTDFGYFLMIILPVLLVINIILPASLITQIRTDGIYVRFRPFQLSFQKFYWSDISEIYIRKYEALKEYFGWGFRIGPNGTGYIVAGDTGIQIILKNGSRVLVTTQRPDEVDEALRRVEKL